MIAFQVKGDPVPKQSFRIGSRKYQPKRLKDWEGLVGWCARQKMCGLEPLEGPCRVKIWFYLKDKRARDLDNLSKGVLDGMKEIVFLDDNQVVDLELHKRMIDLAHPDPGIEVIVMEGYAYG